MNTIQYQIHLLLINKYRLFIHLSIIFTIYSLFYSNNIIYCMNDNPDIGSLPITAESKIPHRSSHQILALKREISSYANSQAHLLERVDEQACIIAEQKQTIEYLEAKNREQHFMILDQKMEIQTQQELIQNQKEDVFRFDTIYQQKNDEIESLKRRLEANSSDSIAVERYKQQLAKMRRDLFNAQTEIEIKKQLLEEVKKDKEQLFSLFRESLNK